jgi:hypothetical protein
MLNQQEWRRASKLAIGQKLDPLSLFLIGMSKPFFKQFTVGLL